MERAAEIFAALTYFALGLSHIVQPRAWAELFLLLKSQGKAGAFVDGVVNLLLGAIIVSFHNVWQGLPMVVTIVGWGQAIKGLRIMVLPQIHLDQIERRISLERAWIFRPAGAGLVALSVLFGYIAFTH
ncbi:MAG: hypothetical protein ABJA98_04310 [Acidobacteriota bacterium]